METTKNFTVRVQLDNVDDQLNPNKKELLHDIIEKRYLDKCHDKSLITKVNKITNYSNCVFNYNDLNNSSSINVSFNANTYKVYSGDYIGNLVITKKLNEKILLCSNRIAGAPTVENINNFKVGDIVPCMVRESVYMPSRIIQSDLSVINLSEIFDTQLENVKIIGLMTDEEKSIINLYIKICFETTNRIEGQEKKVIKFFTELMTPYKKDKPVGAKDKKHKINDDFKTFKEGMILSFPDNIHRMENYVLEVKNKPEKELTLYQFMELVYRDKIRYLNLIHDLVHHFDEKTYDTNKDIWKMMNESKK